MTPFREALCALLASDSRICGNIQQESSIASSQLIERDCALQVSRPKLEIKKDSKGMVNVPGATLVTVDNARQLLSTIEKGQQRRHVGETQMNRESSRSHLIMSIVIEATNLQTQSVTRGKLSFVDLAGSERWVSSPPHTSLLSWLPGPY